MVEYPGLQLVFGPDVTLNPTHCGGAERVAFELSNCWREYGRSECIARITVDVIEKDSCLQIISGDVEEYLEKVHRLAQETASWLLFVNWLPHESFLHWPVNRAVLFCHHRVDRNWGITQAHKKAIKVWFTHSRWLLAELTTDHPDLNMIVALPAAGLPTSYNVDRSRTTDFGYAGALIEEKGVGDLLKAFTKLRQEHLVSMEIAGVPNLWGTGIGLPIAPTPVEGVVWRGAIAHDEMPDFWASVRVCVMPSHLPECLPLSTIEALGAGCRVVASDVPGNREILCSDGQSFGSFFRPGDPEDLALAMGKELHRATASITQRRARAKKFSVLHSVTTLRHSLEQIQMTEI